MANKPLKSIKFPGLNDTYTVPEVDATLATTGAAADAKKVGDEINDLKEDLTMFNSNCVYGIRDYAKDHPDFFISSLHFVYNEDNDHCIVSGVTYTETNLNLYVNTNNFPGQIKPGDYIRFEYNSNLGLNCYLQLFFYINGSWTNMIDVHQKTHICVVPDNATGMIIRIHVKNNVTVQDGVFGFNILSYQSNSSIEKVIPTITPDDTYDSTDTIKRLLEEYGTVLLGEGTYIVNGLEMPDGSSIRGCGVNTVLKTTNSNSHCIIPGQWCSIENVKIQGTRAEISSRRANDAGIYIVGNHEETPFKRNIKISNCFIYGFGLAGIYGAATGYWVANSISAVNCEICCCYAGILLEDYCEFNRFTNILCYSNYTGLMNRSGNNVFVNCSFSNNIVGVYLDCVVEESSGNNGHGAIIGATINHSNNNNGYGILVKNVEHNGFIFDSCHLWYSKVQVERSTGVIIQNSTFGGGTPVIESYTNTAFFLRNNLFKTTPTLTGAMIKDGNYLFDGTPVT